MRSTWPELRGKTAWRLGLTVWLVYAVHFSSNVVRETYLALSLGDHASVRVDEYLGLHPDLFAVPGRGAYINSNPGASFAGAAPYVLARPALDLLYRLRPDLTAPKPPARYDDPRPNRTPFMNAARERGLDVKLGLAALVIQLGLMAPAGAAASVLLFVFLRRRIPEERVALWLALLFAVGTPMFFRAAFLNQNLLIAHLGLAAYVAMAGLSPRPAGAPIPSQAVFIAGLTLGYGVVCDYSALPLLGAFGAWAVADAWPGGGLRQALKNLAWVAVGAAGPALLLMSYQYVAFGHPLWPAQRYMPATPYSVRGWLGFSLPEGALLWDNLFDLRWGLFAFCPLLLLALAAPFVGTRPSGPTNAQLRWIAVAVIGLYLFSSANQFAHLQWNTGVRYMVPAVPLLFLAATPVLLAAQPWLRWAVVAPSLLISWAVSMTREDVPTALAIVFERGPVLPVTLVLERMRSGYPGLYLGPAAPLLAYAALGAALWVVWRRWSTSETARDARPL